MHHFGADEKMLENMYGMFSFRFTSPNENDGKLYAT